MYRGGIATEYPLSNTQRLNISMKTAHTPTHTFTHTLSRPSCGGPYLPPLGALLGELCEVNGLLGMRFTVLLATCLDEERIGGGLSLRLVNVLHHGNGLPRCV